MKIFQVTWKIYTYFVKCYKCIEKSNYNASSVLAVSSEHAIYNYNYN